MKKICKNVLPYLAVVIVSVIVTYGMNSYLSKKKDITVVNRTENYAGNFNQAKVHLTGLTSSGGGYPDFTKVAANAVAAVVHVKSTIEIKRDSQSNGQMIDPFEYFFGFGNGNRSYQNQNPQPQVGFGSGVLISADGYIMTNNHVIDKATDIEVTLNDNRKFKATLVGTDPNTDIALLKIKGKDFPSIPFGNSDNLKVGEWVLAVGNPFNLTSTVTAGIVSAKDRGNLGMGSKESIQSFIQTDAAINPGNSGGALINTNGELVGINTAIYSQTGNFAGYGFAVPISIAGKVVSDIKKYGTVQRAVLGVLIQDVSVAKEVSPDKTKDLKVNEGVYVGGFSDYSPAKQAGIKKGDVIVGINDVKVKNVGELQEQVNKYRPGDKVKIYVKHEGEDKMFVVTLKNSAGNVSIVKKQDGLEIVGAAFKDLSSSRKNDLGISYGVEVSGVDHSGRFFKEGVMKGFIIQKINNQPVQSADQVEQIIKSVTGSEDKVLFIIGIAPNGSRRYFAIDLTA